MHRKCVQTASWTYILRDNLTFSNPHPQLETLSEEQIWTLLVPSALGAWKHSWGPAMCPRHGAPPGLKKEEVQNGPSGWYGTHPQMQPGTDLLSAGFINYFWCWLFFFFWQFLMAFSSVMMSCRLYPTHSHLCHWCVTGVPLCRWEQLSYTAAENVAPAHFPLHQCHGAWCGSNNCDYNLTFSVIQLTAWLVRYCSIL